MVFIGSNEPVVSIANTDMDELCKAWSKKVSLSTKDIVDAGVDKETLMAVKPFVEGTSEGRTWVGTKEFLALTREEIEGEGEGEGDSAAWISPSLASNRMRVLVIAASDVLGEKWAASAPHTVRVVRRAHTLRTAEALAQAHSTPGRTVFIGSLACAQACVDTIMHEDICAFVSPCATTYPKLTTFKLNQGLPIESRVPFTCSPDVLPDTIPIPIHIYQDTLPPYEHKRVYPRTNPKKGDVIIHRSTGVLSMLVSAKEFNPLTHVRRTRLTTKDLARGRFVPFLDNRPIAFHTNARTTVEDVVRVLEVANGVALIVLDGV